VENETMDDELAGERARLRDLAHRVFAERRGAVELLAAHDRGEPVEIDLEPFRSLPERATSAAPAPDVVTHLTSDDVLAVHAALFDLDPEQAADHLRNRDGLDSAVARPRQHAAYGGADIAAQAAFLAHGIAESQLFVDGNKRTALLALDTFLRANGFTVNVPDAAIAAWILALSADATPDDLAAAVRAHLTPVAS
jgi:death-on-curing protein